MSDFAKLVGSLTPEKRALLAQRLSAGGGANKLLGVEPVAITGLSCRFPGGANSPEAYWRLLRDGVDGVKEVPGDRWDADAFYDPDMSAAGKIASRWGGFLDDVEHFDAQFFGITPREAVTMDPQQRLLLEVVWEALEDAGQAADRLSGSRTGVFVGISNSDYALLQYSDPTRIDGYTASGTGCSIAANRLSYVFDLRGPCMAVDTACSSSLVAVHLACQSLRTRESNLAVAGGVMLMLSPLSSVAFSRMGTLASDGRCKTFDARADGYVRGEGCGVVVLKRLSDALADGDHIHGLILGSAVNQDGRTTRLTAPSLVSQELVIRDALENAGVDASQVGYVEAHGTGTALGDPIEVEALSRVFAKGGGREGRCLLGAVKSNIGHLEAAAGIAGLIKVVLSMQRREVPPNLHFKELNPHISLEETPFVISTRLQPWPSDNGRRLAGISSFGAGGTNAHIVLEEAPATSSKPGQNGYAVVAAVEVESGAGVTSSRTYLLPLSARSPEALRQLAARYLDHVGDDSALPELRDLCYTAGARRSHHQHRLCVAASSYEQLRERLSAHLSGQLFLPGVFAGRKPTGQRPKVAFIFPGQGSQWLGMGRGLFESEPVFRAKVEECASAMQPHLD
ncbi:MAG TPA: type I polyketide synthase, partial [Pyrinomonadaceae bacterium]